MFLRWWLVKSLALLSALLAVLPLFAAGPTGSPAPLVWAADAEGVRLIFLRMQIIPVRTSASKWISPPRWPKSWAGPSASSNTSSVASLAAWSGATLTLP